ncbi:MAG TPA: hypothetical protein VMW35_17040 [Myxococcota bacterium]|jgi:hypothetical protein|nr:hypothetical protein [Myxococcota bacterium]
MRRPDFLWIPALALGLAASASANTVTAPTFDPVVRIQGSNPSSGGTGTLIGAQRDGSRYAMVFLAADHTLERIGPLSTIGFGNLASPNLDISTANALDVRTFTKGPDGTEDLALIGITVDLSLLSPSSQSYLTGIAPLGLIAAPASFAPFPFAEFGYGKAGPIVTYGTQQTFANVIDSYLSFSGSYTTDGNGVPLVYTQEMEHWTYDDPGLGDWVPGEGAGYGGFSGSPLLVSAGGGLAVQGIQSSGSDTVNGAQSIGVRFTLGYVSWLSDTGSAYLASVPEPSSGALALVGLAVLAASRPAKPPRPGI